MALFVVKWYRSIKISAIIILFLLSLILFGAMTFLMNGKGKELIFNLSSKMFEERINNTVYSIDGRSLQIEGLAKTMANIVTVLPKNEESFKQILPSLLHFNNDQNIAGGGYWPEPYRFTDNIERRSFFYGRNLKGHLEYFDDYNGPGKGYHQEEWYVPTRYTPPGSCYWSNSYMDPYSYQPMVTCSVPVYEKKSFSGVVTVDLKLEGLFQQIDDLGRSLDATIFIVDRNNKFITFPHPTKALKIGNDEKGNKTVDYTTVTELSMKLPSFSPIAKIVEDINQEVIDEAKKTKKYKEDLVQILQKESYQIDEKGAKILTALLSETQITKDKNSFLMKSFRMFDTFFYKKEVKVFIFNVPKTYWKVVALKPVEDIYLLATEITDSMLIYTISIIFIILVLCYFLLRRFILQPIQNTLVTFSNMEKMISEERFETLLNICKNVKSKENEIGKLERKFIHLSEKFIDAHLKLKDYSQTIEEQNELLEQNIFERTKEIRERNQEIKTTLAHIKQGILSFDAQGIIQDDYSKHLETLLGTDSISGENIFQILFEQTDLEKDHIEKIKESLEQAINQPESIFNTFEATLPNKILYKNNVSLELCWIPLLTETGIVRMMMLSLTNI